MIDRERRPLTGLHAESRRPARVRRGVTHAADSPLDEVAQLTSRLAVLLAAGVAPATAWRHLAELDSTDSADGRATKVVSAIARGVPVAEALTDGRAPRTRAPAGRSAAPGADTAAQAWNGLAAAWQVAANAGAPLAGCLRELASAYRQLAETHRDLRVALSGPAATAHLVMLLPLVGLLFGAGLGFDTVHTLVATLPGLVCLGVGSALMFAGTLWNRRLIRAATPSRITVGLTLDLMAIAMTGGGSIQRAQHHVDRATAECGLDQDPSERAQVDSVIRFATAAGVPAAELLRGEARQLRLQARSLGQRQAAALAVTLMLPLGLCVLPAFMVVGVVPLLITIVSSTLTTF